MHKIRKIVTIWSIGPFLQQFAGEEKTEEPKKPPNHFRLAMLHRAEMGSNFIRNVCRYETRLCVAYVDQITAEAQSLTKHQHWRAYARFPSQFSKIKGPRTSSSHPWSFSSSTSSPSYSKAGFVGWYLSKLESRPLITKSISSCLIYTAADLTSQVKKPLETCTLTHSYLRKLYSKLLIIIHDKYFMSIALLSSLTWNGN